MRPPSFRLKGSTIALLSAAARPQQPVSSRSHSPRRSLGWAISRDAPRPPCQPMSRVTKRSASRALHGSLHEQALLGEPDRWKRRGLYARPAER